MSERRNYTKICEKCGAEFHPFRRQQRGCSRACSLSLAKKGKPNVKRRTGSYKKCVVCGERYWVERYRLKKKVTKYCSRSCLAKAHFPQYQHLNPIRFRAGKSEPRHYKTVMTPDGRRMREHRWIMEKHAGRKLMPHEHVHHINGDWRDNRLENLVLLTNSEHQRVELNETVLLMRASVERPQTEGQ